MATRVIYAASLYFTIPMKAILGRRAVLKQKFECNIFIALQ